jgi:hypothetical protein
MFQCCDATPGMIVAIRAVGAPLHEPSKPLCSRGPPQAMLQWKRRARSGPSVASFVATRQREQELFELGYQRVAGDAPSKQRLLTHAHTSDLAC